MKYLKIVIFIIYIYSVLSLSFGQIPAQIYKSDLTKTENFNYIIPPLNNINEQKAVIVIFPGLFDHPYSVFFETDLVQSLNNAGYTNIIPILSKENNVLHLTTSSIKKVHMLIEDYLLSTNLPKDTKIALGGFSLGGSRAIKTYIYNTQLEDKLNITHLFTIDPPLDFQRFITAERKNNIAELEPIIKNEITTQDFDQYIDSISIFNYNKLENLDALLFKDLKFRIYNEPDLEWQFNQKNRSLMDLNLIDQSILIKYLKSKTPESKTELILSRIKGLRKQTGQRNPHSWNIVDTNNLLNWLSKYDVPMKN